uniref:Uncharacterized protein n=1 Tax=Arundo donax TaxID=35708 RepID=A0A0A9FQD4_ARUDO
MIVQYSILLYTVQCYIILETLQCHGSGDLVTLTNDTIHFAPRPLFCVSREINISFLTAGAQTN